MVIALVNAPPFPESLQANPPETGDNDVLRLEKIGLRYGGNHEIISNLSLSLPRGSFHYLYGITGSGKSSLLKLMAANLPPSRGVMTLFGRDVRRFTRQNLSAIRQKIGIVFQNFRLIEHLTAFDNIALPLRLEKNPETDIRAQVMELLAWMGLGDIHDKLPGTLSAGAQQRLAMARAIINRPSLVLADEPTSHVDDRITHRLIRMLEELNNLGTTIVVATNNAGLIQRFPHPCFWLQPNGLVRLNQAELAALSQDSAPQPPASKTPVLSVNPLTMEQADLQNDPPAPIPDWPEFEQLLSPLRHIERWRR